VLADRGWLTPSELEALGDETEPQLLQIALPLLGSLRHRALDRMLLHAIDHEDSTVHLAALDALALAHRRNAAEAARQAADGPLGDEALPRLAIVGAVNDASWIVERLRIRASKATIKAAGWAGHLAAVPVLIELLSTEDDEMSLAAGEALDRLLGGDHLEEIEVAQEAIDEAPVPAQDDRAGQPLDELVSDPRDRPPSGSPDLLEVPSTDPDLWRTVWAARSPTLDKTKRTRRGHPYTPSSSLWEFDKLHLPANERRHAHRELVATTGSSSRFSPYDFVVVQERCILDWAKLIASSTSTHVAGTWPKAKR
jgi:hypothetical protein